MHTHPLNRRPICVLSCIADLRESRAVVYEKTTWVTKPIELTSRQLDVLRLLAEGRSTAEIATELGLSTTTVRNYIANVLSALGVHTRLQAVVAARKAGLIDL
jgi:DNA-binding NarL/FixJ family response regulator